MASRWGKGSRRLIVKGPRVSLGAADAFTRSPERWLPPGSRSRGRGHWQVTLRLGAVHRDVLLGLGPVWRNSGNVSRACTWHTNPEPGDWLDVPTWLPSFHGSIGVAADAGAPRLRLEGWYVPPFGPAGGLIDRIALGRLARKSAREFLDELTAGLDEAAQTPRPASLPLRSAR